MDSLTIEEINKHIKKPKHETQIKKAIMHEQRIRMHTEAVLHKDEFTEAHNDFFRWVDGLIDEDKAGRLKQLCILPFPTNKLTKSIFAEYPRALSASNKYVKFNFSNQDEALENDFSAYCSSLGVEDFFVKDGVDILKKSINSFIICDIPKAGEEEVVQGIQDNKPKPYFSLLDICEVIDVDCEEDGTADWIIFKVDVSKEEKETIESRVAYFDKYIQQTLVKYKGTSDYVAEIEPITHGILVESKPFCPAFKFWPALISDENEVNSESPITNSLSDLDTYLFWVLCKRYVKLYAEFPIYWGYRQKCDYRQELDGHDAICNHGFLTWTIETAQGFEERRKPCPSCSKQKFLAPGTFVEVEPPEIRDDADLRDPIGRLSGDVATIDLVEKYVKQLEYEIRYDCTGHTPESNNNKQALNADQISTQVDAQVNILDDLKLNFELTMWRLYSVLGSMRYKDKFIGVSLSLGNEYFLRSIEEVNKDYQSARDSGRPAYELARKREVMYQTELQNNPFELNRLVILQNLDPYPDDSPSSMKALGVDVSDPVGFIIKLKFNSFILRFERENNTNIIMFGTSLSFDKKIQAIQESLIRYANEQLQQNNRQNITANDSQGQNLQPNNGQA